MPRIRDGDPVWVERLEFVEFLANTDHLDRTARDGPHRQGGTAAGVAVDTGQYDTGQAHTLVEILATSRRLGRSSHPQPAGLHAAR